MLMDQVDLGHLFDDPPQGFCDLFASEGAEVKQGVKLSNGTSSSSSSPDDFLARIREIENMLMEDGADDGDDDESVTHNQHLSQPFPPLVPVGVNPKDSSGNCSNFAVEEESKEDHVSKKRIRQLRNRDAALRSRERKKLYVKDMEMKSRYLEAECRRLGTLLHCCYAENHMLRLSLHTISLAPKAESAVLLLESLLLGSLLWLLVKVCLLPPLSHKVVPMRALVMQRKVDRRDLDHVAAPLEGRGGSKLIHFQAWSWVSILSKSCKASRTKMKMPATD